MIRSSVVCVLFLALTCFPAAAQQEQKELTLDEIIHRHLNARGGESMLRNIESARIMGTIETAGMDMPFTRIWKRPNKLLMSFTVEGMEVTQAYDGRTAWMIMPLMGEANPTVLKAEDARTLKDGADLVEGLFIESIDRQYRAELLGMDELEGTPAYKIRITKANGDEVDIWLDRKEFLELGQDIRQKGNGRPRQVERRFEDYRQVEGLVIAHTMRVREKGDPVGQTMTLQSIEFDIDVEDSTFSMPVER